MIRGLTFCGRVDMVVPCRGTHLRSLSNCPRARSSSPVHDAALYITKLPKAEHDAEEWQAATEALILVAELDGPTMFAGIGMMRALNRKVEREFNPDRKDHHWRRRKLTRDRRESHRLDRRNRSVRPAMAPDFRSSSSQIGQSVRSIPRHAISAAAKDG